MSDFCIYIATCTADFHHAKVLCASIRYFNQDVPIFLLKDGDFNTDQIKVLGNIHVYDTKRSPTGLSLLQSYYNVFRPFFDPEFDRFLYLDADTLLVQDILTLPWQDYDFLCNRENWNLNDPQARNRIQQLTFDFDRINLFDPDFSVDDSLYFFNSGHFFGRTNILELHDVTRVINHIHSTTESEPLFYLFDQGALNYLVNKAIQTRKLKVGTAQLGVFPTVMPSANFPNLNRETVLSKTYTDHYIIHFTRPTRRAFFHQYDYGDILCAFYHRYYAQLPTTVRWRDQTVRFIALTTQSAGRLSRKIIRKTGSMIRKKSRFKSTN